MLCLHCSAPTSNGLALCGLCCKKGETILEFLPIYFRNLARWRPGRAGSRPVPGSRVLYDGPVRVDSTGDRISDRLDEAANALTTTARMLVDDRGIGERPLTWVDAVLSGDLPDVIADDQPLVIAALCAAFTERLATIATLEWCGEFIREIDQHESVLRGLTEDAIPGWYSGACARRVSMDGDVCGADTFVVPGLTWVKCEKCGATTNAKDRLEVILTEARGWAAPPKRIAEVLVALVDKHESVEDLRKRIAIWAAREKIATIRPNIYAVKKHRLGEVLDRLAS